MWFSYPNEETWFPLEIDRVKEIQQMNKEGIKPEDLKEEAVELEPAPATKILDYENVVGQDSITRLDERPKKKKKKNNNNKHKKNGEVVNVAEPATKEAKVQPSFAAAKVQQPKQQNPQQPQNRNYNRGGERQGQQPPRPQNTEQQQQGASGGEGQGQKRPNNNRHHRRPKNNNNNNNNKPKTNE